jgi:hypothetical protein
MEWKQHRRATNEEKVMMWDSLGNSSIEQSDHAWHGKWIKAAWESLLLTWRSMTSRQWEGMWESRAL